MLKYLLLILLFIACIFVSPIPNKEESKIRLQLPVKSKIIYYGTNLDTNYLNKRLKYAIIFEQIYKVPVKVQIAVDLLESGFTNKKSQFNNDGWITCKCTNNKKLRKIHNKQDICFRAYDRGDKKWYYFKKYKTLSSNWLDKVKIISNYKWFKPNMPFEYYAKHLQGTYASSLRYNELLCKLYRNHLKDMKYDLLYQ